MTAWKPLRMLFIRTTDLTHGLQGRGTAVLQGFYRLWAPLYDGSVGLDPAYRRRLREMIEWVVRPGDATLDVGSGTGLGALHAASIAANVLALDASPDMLTRLRAKIHERGVPNIEVREGLFPQALRAEEQFDSVISSFMLAHLDPEDRRRAIAAMADCLRPGGRLGLFSARGEVASSFETREELESDLAHTRLRVDAIRDVDDIYRITTAKRP